MQIDAERVLNNLHIIAAISHNDKLMTNDDAFNIYTPTTMRGLFRMWYGENRGQNVQRIRSTVRGAISFATKSFDDASALLPDDAQQEVSEMVKFRVYTVALQHMRMMQALKSSCRGLNNMLQTYREDAALSSQLSLIEQEINDFVTVWTPHSELLYVRCGLPPASSSERFSALVEREESLHRIQNT